MSRLVVVLLPCVAGIVTFAGTVAFGLVWDDVIILDDKVRHYRGILDVFREPADLAGLRVYRPITFGSYWVDLLVWDSAPFGLHLTNVVLHGVNAGLVAWLATLLGCGAPAAALAGLLFAVHPIHTEAVAWVACRADLLVTTFTVLTIGAALRDRERPHPAWLGVLVLGTLLAVGSKEVGVAVPLLLLVLEGIGGRAGRAWWQRPSVTAAAIVLYFLARPADRAVGLDPGALAPEGLLGLFGAFGFYVGQLLIPWGVTAYVPEAPAGLVPYGWAVVGVAGALALLLAGERPGTHRRLALAWTVLTLGPPLLVAVAEMLQTKVSERYLYLPSVGLAVLVAGEVQAFEGRLRDRLWQSVAVGALLVLAGVTVVRTGVWRDSVSLWSAVVAVEARDALPYSNLGIALQEAGRIDEADHVLTQALDRRGDPDNRRLALINLGHVRLHQRRGEDAIPLFDEAIAIGPHAWAYHGLGIAWRWRGRVRADAGDQAGAVRARAEAERLLRAGLAINERHHKLHFVLAGVLYDQGRYAEAVEHYRRVVVLAPHTKVAAQAAGAAEQLTRGR